MAIFYSRAALNAILSSTTKKSLGRELWRNISDLGITRQRPTRRGTRAGQRKQRQIGICMGNGARKIQQFPNFNGCFFARNLILHRKPHLHNQLANILNIQNDTFPRSNLNNCIVIDCTKENRAASTEWSPKVAKIMLANVMSLAPKMDEVSEFITRNHINLAFVTETWLKDSVLDTVVDIPGFAIVREDRKTLEHGGVCVYIQEKRCKYKQLNDLKCCDNHETLWLHLRPNRLPRGFSCIIAAVIYHPPKADETSIREHLFQSLVLAETRYPNCGLVVTGDFNRLDIKGLLNHFRLQQIVQVQTRKDAILDLVLTNMQEYYNPPQAYPPFGLSDHNAVVVSPKDGKRDVNRKHVVKRRDLRESNKAALGRYLTSIDWPLLFAPTDSCQEKWEIFHTAVHTGLDILMPEKEIRTCSADAPWIDHKLKSMILKRQKAFKSYGGDSAQFKFFRNLVNRERKACRAKYYEVRIQNLRQEAPKKWWDEVKRLSGSKRKNGDLLSQIDVEGFSELSLIEKANTINAAFLEPLEEYRLPTPLEFLPMEANTTPEILHVGEQRVQKVLSHLNPGKACGPDRIPNWLLKEYSDAVAFPVTEILNASYSEQHLPKMWKLADVTPLPKKKSVKELKKDLRPISLTSCISKVAEGFIVDDYVKPAVMSIIDDSQYGAIPNSSTTMALISMLHNWSINTDGNGATIRTIVFDYRKAFDFIDHEILIRKLRTKCKLPVSITNWIVDFLSDRSQRIKLAAECFSEWGSVPSGVPQGTKLGPWLFVLMINDLEIAYPLWKYVDDTTASEMIPKESESHAQNIADCVIEWSRENRVHLNSEKCKELRISFSKRPGLFDPIVIEGKELEVVGSVKLLGLNIASDLTWNSHISEVIKKASKRLYFLVQLKRARVPLQDLVLFYTSCVRSVTEYAIPVFYNALPQYLKNELLRIEKRSISIITAGDCAVAQDLGIRPILEHYEFLCQKLFKGILDNPSHKLKALLPPIHKPSYNFKNKRQFNMPRLRTSRTMNTFIFAMARRFNG